MTRKREGRSGPPHRERIEDVNQFGTLILMKRRSVLKRICPASAAVLLAGCNADILGPHNHRLRFLRVENIGNATEIDVRVKRDGETVYEKRYNLPSMPEGGHVGEPKATYVAGRPHVRFQEASWNTEPANFVVEYRMAGQPSWKSENFATAETPNVGIEIRRLQTSFSSINHRVLDFKSEEQVQRLLTSVEEERRNSSV